MADRHDSRTGRDEQLSPTIPVDSPRKDAAAQKADAQAERDKKEADAAADKAEVDAIAARRKGEDEARVVEKKTKAEAEEARQARVAAGVDNYIGFDIGGGQVSYLDNPEPHNVRARTLQIGELVYEHTSTDDDGVWLYRHLK